MVVTKDKAIVLENEKGRHLPSIKTRNSISARAISHVKQVSPPEDLPIST